jgi:hypothetical protein
LELEEGDRTVLELFADDAFGREPQAIPIEPE